MDVRENDPILSRDGSRIVAYWARGYAVKGPVLSVAVLRNIRIALYYAAEQTLDPAAVLPTANFRALFEAPDRTYWGLVNDAPDGWEYGEMFRLAPVEPSPEAAGMVTAINLVLKTISAGSMFRDDLTYQLKYWESRVIYENERRLKNG